MLFLIRHAPAECSIAPSTTTTTVSYSARRFQDANEIDIQLCCFRPKTTAQRSVPPYRTCLRISRWYATP